MNTQPRNAQDAIQQANRFDRAQLIIKEGYSFTFDAELNTVFVCKPGRLAAEYTIGEQLTGRDGCSCPDFQRNGKPCKHMLAWKIIQSEEADEEKMWEAQCAEYDAQEAEEGGFIVASMDALTRMRNLLHAELTEAENKAVALHQEPFCSQSAVRSWADKAHRCKVALQTFDVTMNKIECGLLAL